MNEKTIAAVALSNQDYPSLEAKLAEANAAHGDATVVQLKVRPLRPDRRSEEPWTKT